MSTINKKHFTALTRDREDSLRLLNKSSMRGIRDSVVERYSEQAHFVYELLQNADDVQATKVQFKLRKEGLYFIHNGKVPFTVTPPNAAKAGHINAITSIGASSKKDENYKIGKFGIGFKSVFQYTQTPHIYDENVNFKIRDLIVPEMLEEENHPLKKAGETLFFFPFDHAKKTAKQAQQEIQNRLEELEFPLLFLNYLTEIIWETEETAGFFRKMSTSPPAPKEELIQANDNSAANDGNVSALNENESNIESYKITSIKQVGKKTESTHFFQLSKQENVSGLKYCVVFNLKKINGSMVIDDSQKFAAHCFFPTRVQSNLRFLIHAPFLLTDSREGIKLEHEWNQQLIANLAKLPIEGIGILQKNGLLTADFFQAMPFSEKTFTGKEGRFFQPFFREWYLFLKNTEQAIWVVKSGDLDETESQVADTLKVSATEQSKSQVADTSNTPQNTNNQSFTNAKNAFIADSQSLRQLLNSQQLANLFQQPNANWVFPHLPTQTGLGAFLRQILIERAQLENRQNPVLNWEVVLKKMDAPFLEKQPDNWLIFLYEELLHHHRSLWYGERAIAKQIPLIRLSDDTQISVNTETRKKQVYLPTDLSTGYLTVKKSIANHPNARLFLENLGLTTPELRDELEQFILPKYQKDIATQLPTSEDLKKLFLHYQNCNAEDAEAFCSQLKTLPVLLAISQKDDSVISARPTEVYFLNEHLSTYFSDYEKVKWLDLKTTYADILKKVNQARFLKFLTKIGVADLPRFQAVEDTLEEAEKKALMQPQTPGASYAMWEEIIDYSLEGLESFLAKINEEKSRLLWQILTEILAEKETPMNGIYRYEYEDTHEVGMDAFWVRLLKKTPWLKSVNETLLSPNKLSINQLHSEYHALPTHPLPNLLFQAAPQERLNLLTPEERRAMELGQRLLNQGLKAEDWQQFKNWQKIQTQKTEKREKKPRKPKPPPSPPQDADEFNPAFMSSEELLAKQEELRQKLEGELEEQIEQLMVIERLKAAIKEAETYSFLWFNSLLELELLLALDQTDKDKSLKIEFGKIEPEEGASKIILLKNPINYLSPRIESMGDITLKIQLENERRTLAVDVVSIKETSLRAKLKTPEEMDGIDFKTVRGATLEIQNTIFTLEELKKSFAAMDYSAEHCMKKLLPTNIRFIFGPPGTGKTTHLAAQEIMPTMLGEQSLKMLVLTPTNKSADVLIRKILSLQTDTPDWLLRFGTSGDSVVENAGLLCDQTLKIEEYERFCLVTTATRFPYDGFHYQMEEWQLKNMDWDVILVDEASMIPLPMITYILHQQPKAEVIIAGDPFQIEPIVFAEEWKGQNIYSMVNLQSFDPAEQIKNIEPHPFSILNLLTQYRAISTLGYIFSHFAYDGKLRHHRLPKSRRPLTINKLPLKDVNIIRFPTNKLETLFRPQRLNNSHFHIYSALLTSEIVKHLVEQIYDHHIEGEDDPKPWRIGIICPYKAQAMLVDKIIAAQNIFRPNVTVNCGTIHSFQGDECDIMFNLFNPPYNISKSPNMFLNRRNILNVAVSRAKNYLILLIPDDQTENIENLYQINRLKQIIRYFLAGVCQEWHSYEVEELLFGEVDYLEKNSFATTHQSINVYTEPEQRFEIRVEDAAVDVQIRMD